MTESTAGTRDLIGREAELAVMGERMAAARAGEGGALLLSGAAGAGKTSLIGAAVELAGDFQIVRCRGVDSEMELPLSALNQLLLPLRGAFDALTEEDRATLGSAVSLGESGASTTGLAMATLTLLADLAATRPVLVVVDDLHWVDEASLAVFAFVARRIGHDRVLLLAATRPNVIGEPLEAQRLSVSPLSTAATGMLIERQLDFPLLPSAVEAITAATEGNPLAVIETARYVGADASRLGTVLDEPPPATELIQRGFAERLAGLSEETRLALTLLATTLNPSADVLQTGLEHLGVAADAFDAAQAAQIIRRATGSIEFSHPLFRALVHHDASPADLRRAHAALADAAPDRAARAWHAAAASDARDEHVAGELEGVAYAFVGLGGNAAAARALERSAQLSPDPEARARRLFQAAFAARLAALTDWAQRLLREASQTTADSGLRLKIDVEATILDWQQGRYAPVSQYRAVAEAAFPIDPALAIDALILAANTLTMVGRVTDALEIVERLEALPPIDDHRMRTAGQGVRGVLLVLSATDPDAGRQSLLRSAREGISDPYVESGSVAEALVWIEEFAAAGDFLAALLNSAETTASYHSLMILLPIEGGRRIALGDWADGGALIERAMRLAEIAKQPFQLGLAASKLALLRAAEGDPVVHELARTLEDGIRTHNFVVYTPYRHNALGLYALGAGQSAEAVVELERARDWAQPAGYVVPGLFSWPWDLAEAYADLGRTDAARQTLETFRPIAERTGSPTALAVVARLDGMLASADEFAAHFEAALTHHARTANPFERARTHLHFGRRLRQAGEQERASGQLEQAAETFSALGATSWHQRTVAELHAVDATLAPAESLPQLTRQESIVARHVAEGMTNKQIAAHLFLTPKTIEWHLRQIYRKLGITSRVQLAAHVHAGRSADVALRG